MACRRGLVTCYSCPRTAAAHFAASSGAGVGGEGAGAL